MAIPATARYRSILPSAAPSWGGGPATSSRSPRREDPGAQRSWGSTEYPEPMVAEPQATVGTIGHGTRTTDELASLLVTAGVSTLIDVRRYPLGRRQPHFSRERL